jgi:hypothetical protein
VFTSSSTTPTPGNWEGISLWNEGSATITYATISYGGSGNGDIAVTSDTNVLDIKKFQAGAQLYLWHWHSM